MSRVDPKFKEKFSAITSKPYNAQAKWYLNGFWTLGAEAEAENVWKFANKFMEIDKRKKEGNDLDEFEAHKFLESLGETLTVVKLREELRQIDVDNNNRMALIEYLMFRYNKSVEQVVNAPQSDNKEELEMAQKKVEAAQNALENVQRKLESQRQAEEEVKKAEVEVKKAEEQVRKSEEEARKAEEENKAALAELKKQEDDYHRKCADLEAKTKEGTIVQKNKAVQELAQLKSEDPLPLRKAKITQESAVRKAEKARKQAEDMTAAAVARTEDAKKRTREAQEATRQTEAAVVDANKRVQEALDFLDEVKSKGGSSQGDIWWMQREIQEAKKYLPKSKQ
jgi:chromosome segregation ATPase